MLERSCGTLCAFSLALLLASAARATTLDEVTRRGRLIVLSYPHPQSEFIRATPEAGFAGLDFDIMRAFAARLDVTLEIRPVESFDRLIPELLAGHGDVIASSFSITAERRKLVDYSTPYFPVVLMVVARPASGLSTPEDIASRVGCVVKGSSQEERLDRLAIGRKHFVEQTGDCWGAVETGAADLALLDSTTVLAHLDSHPSIAHAFDLPVRDEYGFAIAPGSDLRGALDAFITESRRQGFLYRLIERHFGKQGAEFFRLMPGN